MRECEKAIKTEGQMVRGKKAGRVYVFHTALISSGKKKKKKEYLPDHITRIFQFTQIY